MEFYIDRSPQIVEVINPSHSFTKYFVKKNAFDNKHIKRLEDLVNNNYTFSKGLIGNNNTEEEKQFSLNNNNRDIAYIEPNSQSKWLYELLFPIAIEANEELFHFDIDSVTDLIHYVVYPEDEGHLTWHKDITDGQTMRRKLAMTVQLSNSSDYEGGEFQIWNGGENSFETITRERGDVIVFPTFYQHRVTPITKGERKCLVFWTGGRPFK